MTTTIINRPARPGTRATVWVAASLIVAWTGEALAQDAQFGLAPSERTQRAISDPPTRSDREDEGLYAAVGIAFSQRRGHSAATARKSALPRSSPVSRT